MVVIGFVVGLLLVYASYLIEDAILRNIGVVLLFAFAIPLAVKCTQKRGAIRKGLKRANLSSWMLVLLALVAFTTPPVLKELQTCGKIDLAFKRSACVFRLEQRLAPGELFFSSDSAALLTVSHARVYLRNAETGQRLLRLRDSAHPPLSAAMSPDGRAIATGTRDGWVQIWSLEGERIREWQIQQQPVYQVAYLPGGDRLVSRSGTSDINIWSPEGEHLGRLPHNTAIADMAVAELDDVGLVATSSEGKVRIWTLVDRATPVVLDPPSGAYAIALQSSGNLVASADNRGLIQIWDTETGNLIETLQGSPSRVNSLAFSADGNFLLAGSSDRKVRLWDVQEQSLVKEIGKHRSPVASIALSPDARHIAVAVAPSLANSSERAQARDAGLEPDAATQVQVTVWQTFR